MYLVHLAERVTVVFQECQALMADQVDQGHLAHQVSIIVLCSLCTFLVLRVESAKRLLFRRSRGMDDSELVEAER